MLFRNHHNIEQRCFIADMGVCPSTRINSDASFLYAAKDCGGVNRIDRPD